MSNFLRSCLEKWNSYQLMVLNEMDSEISFQTFQVGFISKCHEIEPTPKSYKNRNMSFRPSQSFEIKL